MSEQPRPVLSLASPLFAGDTPAVQAAGSAAMAAVRAAAGAYTAFAAACVRELFPLSDRALFTITEDDGISATLAVVLDHDRVLWACPDLAAVLLPGDAERAQLAELSDDTRAAIHDAVADALEYVPWFLTKVDLVLPEGVVEGRLVDLDISAALAASDAGDTHSLAAGSGGGQPFVSGRGVLPLLVDGDGDVVCPHCGTGNTVVQIVGRNLGAFTVEDGRLVAVAWDDAQLDTGRIVCGSCRCRVGISDDVEQTGR